MSLSSEPTLTTTPPDVKPIPAKWVFKKKRDASGNVVRYKSRLVAKGYKQVEGIDFSEVYAPVCKQTTVRALLAIVADRDMELHQLDVKTAFLNGEVDEDLYMQQPPGYVQGVNLVCKLHKSLYGLKQAPRAWYTKLKHELEKMGFRPTDADPGLFVRADGDDTVFLAVHVDDMLVAACKESTLLQVKSDLSSIFDLHDIGPATYHLGMEIQRDRDQHTLLLSQKKYATKLVTKFSLSDAKPQVVPLSTSTKLSRADGSTLTSEPYAELVSGLMYLATYTRPDLA